MSLVCSSLFLSLIVILLSRLGIVSLLLDSLGPSGRCLNCLKSFAFGLGAFDLILLVF